MNPNMVKLRPEARIVKTLGENLIKDNYAAIIELIKNGYDADATEVEVKFINFVDEDKAKIEIRDNGHGMSFDTVKKRWLIPGTSDKAKRRISPKGRKMLGDKGIGRLAAGKLGGTLYLDTTDENGETTEILIDWSFFEKEKYLDEIEFPIEHKQTGKTHGTILLIETIELDDWDAGVISELVKEIRKLLSPVSKQKEDFRISLDFTKAGSPEFTKFTGTIDPYPVLDYYDYRLHGEIDHKGNGNLKLEIGIDRRIPPIDIPFGGKLGIVDFCGKIEIDFRVFDRGPDAIDDLLRRSNLKDLKGNFLGKREARELLNEIQGIGIYRGNFRIRPYGDSGYDWLGLDKRRVQNPSLRIGHNQISGIITIQESQLSNLEEKSSREGLVENKYYSRLKEVLGKVLGELETRRFAFRKKIGRGRVSTPVEETLESLFDFSSLEKSVNTLKSRGKLDEESRLTIITSIEKERRNKEEELEEIREVLARYERQVTLGKIIKVVMHEGKNPLNYMRDSVSRFGKWMECISEINIPFENCKYSSDEILSDLETLKKQTAVFIELISRLDPLAKRIRTNPKAVNISNLIKHVFNVFKADMKSNEIEFIQEYNKDMSFYGVENDIFAAITNLFDNSTYWLKTISKSNKHIKISCRYEGRNLVLDFVDNGPGIKEDFVNMIFEPDFSTKPEGEGTGLGLAIAGEAIDRNNGKLELMDNKDGAYFRIELPKGDE